MSASAKIEFGDFQTPLPLAREICALVKREGIKAETVLEPTCGVGAFLVAAAEAFPSASGSVAQLSEPRINSTGQRIWFHSSRASAMLNSYGDRSRT